MQLVRGTHHLTGSVVTWGNFDGVHRGHQQLLNELVRRARTLQLPSVVMTFEPHPKAFFSGQSRYSRLMRFRDKWHALQSHAIDYLLCLRFNRTLADLSAEAFVKTILVQQLQAKAIVIGDDFRFGAKRAGDCFLLQQLGEQYGFEVVTLSTVYAGEQRVSSTRVRDALNTHDLTSVRTLLGHPYRLSGTVIAGDQRGRALGFPTANLRLASMLIDLSGIFVVSVWIGARRYQGVASIGVRPMFPLGHRLLEVHLFDFAENIYGQSITVEFLHRLREERRFDKVEALVRQMHQDVTEAKNYFARLASCTDVDG